MTWVDVLPAEDNPPVSYRLVIPRLPRKWISANERTAWHLRARKTRQWRDMTAWTFRGSTLRFPGGAHVFCELRFAGVRVRDPANWAPTAKAVLDGLVDAGIFPDDSSQYVIGPDMRLGEPVPKPADEVLIVHIFPDRRLIHE